MLGLGRSGVSAAKAAQKAGFEVVVVDEKPANDPSIQAALEELGGLRIEVKPGWHGGLFGTGASTVVTSPGVPKDHPLLLGAVADGIDVISEIELAFQLAEDPIVAITGTNGKSTTTVMAWLCAKACGWDAVLCGNIYGSGYDEAPLVEAASGLSGGSMGGSTGGSTVSVESGLPSPPKLATLTGTVKPPDPLTGTVKPRRALIAEISSFQLEWVGQFRPKAAVITNITPDHLNRYASFAEYADTKRRIFNRMGPDEIGVWHAADTITEPPAGIRTLTFGPQGDDSWTDALRMRLLGEVLPLEELPFTEPHNYLNAMAAALLVHGLNERKSDPAELFEGLKAFRGLAHRMERVGERDGVLVVNNSMCTNPAAVIASSESLPRPQRLLIGGVNKNLDFGPVGEYLRRSGHAAYLFGSDARSIARQIGGDWPVFTTLKEAFAAAISDAKAGEAVMLAPGVASTDQFADFRGRGEAFRSMAKEWLNENMD